METNTDLKASIGELAHLGSDAVERLSEDLRAGAPSRPLFGVLPVARVIPQDIHSIHDYAGGVALGIGAALAESSSARAVGYALGAGTIGVSLLTDYRLSAAKVIPIEVHEALDYVVGLSAIAAPFALGYYKKDPIAAAVHVVVGATMLIGSLVTDYRSAVGRRWFGAGRPDEQVARR